MATPSKTKPARLTGNVDLLTYYGLIPIYNKYVRPYPPPDRAAGLDPTLFPYVSEFLGNNTMDADRSLLHLLRDPQVNEKGPRIEKIDAQTLRDAYSLKEGPIPGFDKSSLGMDDGGSLTPSGAFGVSNDRGTHGTDGEAGERKHKKKKKKRKHSHEHDEDGHLHSEHKKKKKKRKKEKEAHRGEIEGESVIVD